MQRLDFIIYHSALYAETGLHYISFCRSMQRLSFCSSMQRLGFIIYHSVALCRDWASLYIILSLYAETGLHYISFCRSMQRLGFIIYHSAALCRDWTSLYIILPLYAETGFHYISFCRSMQRLGLHYISFCRSMQRLGFIIYHSAALCRDWASFYIILLYLETGLHYISLHATWILYISFCRSM